MSCIRIEYVYRGLFLQMIKKHIIVEYHKKWCHDVYLVNKEHITTPPPPHKKHKSEWKQLQKKYKRSDNVFLL
jgi:hypothetical protein